MGLITCPACEQYPVSDQAPNCPRYGHPIASASGANASAPGNSTEHAMLPGISTKAQGIADLTEVVHGAQCRLLSQDEVRAVAQQIAKIKGAIFATQQDFLDASLEAATLILGDDDLELLNKLTSEQRGRFRALYALGCDRLNNSAIPFLVGFTGLERLDLSYSAGFVSSCSPDGKAVVFNGGADLAQIENIYLRSCRRMDSTLFYMLLRRCPLVSGVYLDGNPQLDLGNLMFLNHTPAIEILSITNCRQLAGTRDGVELLV